MKTDRGKQIVQTLKEDLALMQAELVKLDADRQNLKEAIGGLKSAIRLMGGRTNSVQPTQPRRLRRERRPKSVSGPVLTPSGEFHRVGHKYPAAQETVELVREGIQATESITFSIDEVSALTDLHPATVGYVLKGMAEKGEIRFLGRGKIKGMPRTRYIFSRFTEDEVEEVGVQVEAEPDA